MELEREAVVPLRIRHLEQINLRHRAGYIQQRIDSAKVFESSLTPECQPTQVRGDRARRPVIWRRRNLRQQRSLCSSSLFLRCKHHSGEIARQPHSGSTPDSLTCAGNDSDGSSFHIASTNGPIRVRTRRRERLAVRLILPDQRLSCRHALRSYPVMSTTRSGAVYIGV